MKTSTKFLVAIILTTAWSFIGQAQTNYGVGSGTQGNRNSFFGQNAGHNITTGNFNSFLGYASGLQSTTGRYNAFYGVQSGQLNTTGSHNVFLGGHAGINNTSGNRNSFVGFGSGGNNKDGIENVFMGTNTGLSNTSGNSNVFLGYNAGFNNTTGRFNTFVGYQSGYTNPTGYDNTYIGWRSGYNATGYRNVFIGFQAGFNETGNHKLYIENSIASTPLIYGDFSTDQLGINTNIIPTGYTLAVNGKIISEELKVRTFATWPDYVFEKGYELKSLSQIETYIRKNGHLPNVPSAKEVAENGFNVGEINATLLEKVEELTLYAIAQQKQMTSQNQQLIQQHFQTVQQKNELNELKILVNTLLEKK